MEPLASFHSGVSTTPGDERWYSAMYFVPLALVRNRRAHSTPGTRARAGTCSSSYHALNALSTSWILLFRRKTLQFFIQSIHNIDGEAIGEMKRHVLNHAGAFEVW